jgi:hypothetical protein
VSGGEKMTVGSKDHNYAGTDDSADWIVQKCLKRVDTDLAQPIKIRACVFFDGTLNNRTNVRLGANYKKDDSYKNALSNIAILEGFYKKDKKVDYSFHIYVEGVGTTNEASDSTLAAVTGKGSTGILDKVKSGINQVVEQIMMQINSKAKGNRKIEHVYLDVFGFSRGAAAARNFVYATLHEKGKTLKDQLIAKGYLINKVKVKFVGLYDTVASFGFGYDNNTIELHLDSISSAEYVVQLAAAEEYRKNFRLTNIDSAPNKLQIFLPGTHSDIGGGYVENSSEINLQVLDFDKAFGLNEAHRAAIKRERLWLIDSGWYWENEIHNLNLWNELKVTRNRISNLYSRIPLKLMARYANKQGVVFSHKLLDQNPIPQELGMVEMAINKSQALHPDIWCKTNSRMMKYLRHGYLHFSSYYGSLGKANEPQFTNNDPVNGRRERIIQNGKKNWLSLSSSCYSHIDFTYQSSGENFYG